LNASSLNPQDWDCNKCPVGAGCSGSITFEEVLPLFGWARCATQRLLFTRCIGAACLGVPNPMLEGYYFGVPTQNSTDNIHTGRVDLAMQSSEEMCAFGHVNPPANNTRCTQCEDGFVPSPGAVGACQICRPGGSIIFLFFGVFLAVVVFVILMVMKMRSSGRPKAAHSTLKRTVLTHVQMVAIIMSLKVPWPSSIRTVLNFMGSIISVSGHTDSIHCSTGTKSIADVYFSTLIIAACLPVLVVVITWLYWFLLVSRCPAFGCNKNLRISDPSCCVGKKNCMTTTLQISDPSVSVNEPGKVPDGNAPPPTRLHWKSTRDGWITTNVYFIYIVFPSIVRMSLEVFQCEEICGVSYLSMDDQEICFGERHFNFVVIVAIPALLLYLLLVPMATLLYLKKNSNLLQTNKKLIFRFGLIFSGYRQERWWWEVLVVGRKVMLIFVVTFGRSNQSQLHFALGCLIVMLHLQERGRPFENENGNLNEEQAKLKAQNRLLHLSEVSSMCVLLLMTWVGVFFNLSPCNREDWDCVVLSFMVFVSNLIFVICCTYVGCLSFGERNQISSKLGKISMRLESVRSSFSLKRMTGRNKNNGDDNTSRGLELFDMSNAETKIRINPLSNIPTSVLEKYEKTKT
jgi:hypothetical protein